MDPYDFANGHTSSNIPDPIRTRKSSGERPGQYWGGGPPGKPLGCCQLFSISAIRHLLPKTIPCTENGHISRGCCVMAKTRHAPITCSCRSKSRTIYALLAPVTARDVRQFPTKTCNVGKSRHDTSYTRTRQHCLVDVQETTHQCRRGHLLPKRQICITVTTTTLVS